MKIQPISAIILLTFLTSCSTFKTTQTESYIDGKTNKITQVTIRTFFDANAELAKLRTTFTDKSQGITVGNLNETSSGSNAVNILSLIAEAAFKAGAASVIPGK